MVVCLEALAAEQPDQFFDRVAGDEGTVASTRERRANGQRVAKVVDGSLAEYDESAAIIIADEWRRTIWPCDVQQEVEQCVESRLHGRRRGRRAGFRQQLRVQIEVRGVAVIRRG